MPCVRRIVRAVAGLVLVIGIFEGVAGILIDLDFDLLSLLFHGRLKFVDVIGCDALILRAEAVSYTHLDVYKRQVPDDRAKRDLHAAFEFLESQPNVNKKRIGAIGWCMGGGYAMSLIHIFPSAATRAACCEAKRVS